ncbi:MAG: PH domain-containing protein [Planctomycetaceae bacterium]|jgi:membrane protein YdbS with pleckstrin-like domain|nr:PH domain-containing protein [Planctomycetaceae bacterium]
MDFLEDEFRNVLDRNETILWTGSPNFWVWMLSAIPALGFGLVWGIFDFGFSAAWLSHAPSEMNYFFIPFMLVHSVPCWGSVLYVFWLFLSHKNAAYAFTDKRVMIRGGLFGIDYQIIDYDKIRDIQVNVNPIEKICDVGSILFNTEEVTIKGAPLMKRFCGIENPYDVFRRIKEVSLDTKTDWNYPNANRPETNPGYRTKYTRDNES